MIRSRGGRKLGARNERSASLTTSSSSLAWPRGRRRWTETWRLSCSPAADVSRRNSCLTPRSPLPSARDSSANNRELCLLHCWRASGARFVISASCTRDRAVENRGRSQWGTKGEQTRFRKTDDVLTTTRAFGGATIICSTDGWTDGRTGLLLGSRALSTFPERTDCHRPFACTYVHTHARTQARTHTRRNTPRRLISAWKLSPGNCS